MENKEDEAIIVLWVCGIGYICFKNKPNSLVHYSEKSFYQSKPLEVIEVCIMTVNTSSLSSQDEI